MKINYLKNTRGYTIVETMISISIFLVIIVMGIGTLLNANLLHQKSNSMRSIMDNLNFVMEDMSRNLRTGYNYHCFISGETIPASTSSVMSTPKSCASGWAISFEYAYGDSTDTDGDQIDHDDQWVYYIDNTGKIFKSTQGPYAVASFVQLTPNEIVIDTAASSFSVLGAESVPGNEQQPFITIRLVGKITYKDTVTPFSLQTSVSQRLVDI